MKKVILFLSIIGTTFLMTSCLGETSNNYAEPGFVYIAETPVTTYGRTHTGRFITSTGMQMMMPGTIQFFSYSWDEEYGTVQVADNVYADNVVITGDNPVEIDIKTLWPGSVPEDEDPDKFVEVAAPFFVNDQVYFGDNWLIQYAYESKKGEEANLEFYIREEPDDNVDVTIDIRLVITGEPESGASTTSTTDITALDMSPVRNVATDNPNEIRINFHYYLKDRTEPTTSQTYRLSVSED